MTYRIGPLKQPRESQQRHSTGRGADAIPAAASSNADGSATGSDVVRFSEDAVAAAVDEVRKSARKRRPPKLLAEDDDYHDGTTPQPPAVTVKRQRQAEEKRTADDSIKDERQQAHTSTSGRSVSGR